MGPVDRPDRQTADRCRVGITHGFFVVAEFALVKIRDSQIKTLTDEGVKQAVFVKQIKDNLNAYLSACQVGITPASLGLVGWGNLSSRECSNRFSLWQESHPCR